MIPTIIAIALAILVPLCGGAFKLYASKQKELAAAHTGKLQELESENKEQARAIHALDIRLTSAEGALLATSTHVTSIKEDLATMRTEIREDLRSFMETITQRIDAIAHPHRRK